MNGFRNCNFENIHKVEYDVKTYLMTKNVSTENVAFVTTWKVRRGIVVCKYVKLLSEI